MSANDKAKLKLAKVQAKLALAELEDKQRIESNRTRVRLMDPFDRRFERRIDELFDTEYREVLAVSMARTAKAEARLKMYEDELITSVTP